MDNMPVSTSIQQASIGQQRMIPLGHTGFECRLACAHKPHAHSVHLSAAYETHFKMATVLHL
jgi:hypothetical protein